MLLGPNPCLTLGFIWTGTWIWTRAWQLTEWCKLFLCYILKVLKSYLLDMHYKFSWHKWFSFNSIVVSRDWTTIQILELNDTSINQHQNMEVKPSSWFFLCIRRSNIDFFYVKDEWKSEVFLGERVPWMIYHQ